MMILPLQILKLGHRDRAQSAFKNASAFAIGSSNIDYLKLSPKATLSRKSWRTYFQKSQGAFAYKFAPMVPVMSIQPISDSRKPISERGNAFQNVETHFRVRKECGNAFQSAETHFRMRKRISECGNPFQSAETLMRISECGNAFQSAEKVQKCGGRVRFGHPLARFDHPLVRFGNCVAKRCFSIILDTGLHLFLSGSRFVDGDFTA